MQRASLDFGFREELLRPAAAWRQTPLNLTVTCVNRVSRWSWQHWLGILGVQGYFRVSLMSVVVFLVRRCQLVGLWCKVSVTPDGDVGVSHLCETAPGGSRVRGTATAGMEVPVLALVTGASSVLAGGMSGVRASPPGCSASRQKGRARGFAAGESIARTGAC